jgi:hypothetical protein
MVRARIHDMNNAGGGPQVSDSGANVGGDGGHVIMTTSICGPRGCIFP